MHTLRESTLDPAAALAIHDLPAGEPWLHEVKRGQTLRIVDLEGNQAVDTIFYNAADSRMSADGYISWSAGWMIAVRFAELPALLTADEYAALTAE